MILRRLAAHLKNQHWTSVFIELAIVVLGVFIGMQVSNWNQQRVTDQQAAVFTARLKADLREEYWAYEFLIAYSGEVRSNALRAVEALEGKAPLSDEALLINAYRATQYKQRLRRRSTYDELISTGNIGLIRDQTLRDTAMRLYNVATIENLALEGLRSRYREAFRMTLPNDVQGALSKNCGDRYIQAGDFSRVRGILDYPCSTGLSAQVIAESARALRTNAQLLPLLRLRIADIDTRLGDLIVNNRQILQGLQAVVKEEP